MNNKMLTSVSQMIQDCNNVLEQLNLSEKTERLFSSNYSQVPLLTLQITQLLVSAQVQGTEVPTARQCPDVKDYN